MSSGPGYYYDSNGDTGYLYNSELCWLHDARTYPFHIQTDSGYLRLLPVEY